MCKKYLSSLNITSRVTYIKYRRVMQGVNNSLINVVIIIN